MEITILDQREVLGKGFKVYGTVESPLFLAKDVAEWIEHSNVSVMLKSIDENEVTKHCLGGLQGESNFLTEDGLYEVLMLSRKPIAKEFKKQVKEILKSIRKHGMYATDELLDNPDLLIQVATQLKIAREEKKLLEVKIESDKPKVIFAEALEVSENTILIGELAKLLNQNGINIGQNRLFKNLREEGYLGKKGELYNMPTQRSMDLKILKIKKSTINNPDGSIRVTKTTKVTGKGQIYFVNKFKRLQAV
jgi:anti-repressor protein